jgi:hypothetical protein
MNRGKIDKKKEIIKVRSKKTKKLIFIFLIVSRVYLTAVKKMELLIFIIVNSNQLLLNNFKVQRILSKT